MTRPRVKPNGLAEVLPLWWIELWHDHQQEIRHGALSLLQDHRRAMTSSEIHQARGAYYLAAEVRHALDRLVAEGVLRRFERPESRGPGRGSRTLTYYELAEGEAPC